MFISFKSPDPQCFCLWEGANITGCCIGLLYENVCTVLSVVTDHRKEPYSCVSCRCSRHWCWWCLFVEEAVLRELVWLWVESEPCGLMQGGFLLGTLAGATIKREGAFAICQCSQSDTQDDSGLSFSLGQDRQKLHWGAEYLNIQGAVEINFLKVELTKSSRALCLTSDSRSQGCSSTTRRLLVHSDSAGPRVSLCWEPSASLLDKVMHQKLLTNLLLPIRSTRAFYPL